MTAVIAQMTTSNAIIPPCEQTTGTAEEAAERAGVFAL
jgi:hypothetical protein